MITMTRYALFDDRVLGVMQYEGETFYTIERPWEGNTPFESCIPTGYYKLQRVDSPKFGPQMWEVCDVPNRTHILIHVANYSRDVVGCIGLGSSVFPHLEGVSNSRRAIQKFYELTKGLTEEELIIKEGVLR